MFNWKKGVITTIIISLLFVSYVQIFVPGRSSYSFLIKVLDCNNIMPMRGCRHEIGHKMDDNLGRQSSTKAFSLAMAVYMMNPPDNDFTKLLKTYPDIYNYSPGPATYNMEIYAAIYAWSDGDVSRIPELLRQFYSDDQSYLKLYDCLSPANRLNICGVTSVSYINS